jgi:hypothetical protein
LRLSALGQLERKERDVDVDRDGVVTNLVEARRIGEGVEVVDEGTLDAAERANKLR